MGLEMAGSRGLIKQTIAAPFTEAPGEQDNMDKDRRLARYMKSIAALALTVGLVAGTTACDRKVNVRGNMPDPEVVLEVQPGYSNRNEVLQILGSPSTVSTFMDDTWYYIGYRTEQFAFLDPEVVDRSVLTVQFNDAGVVDDTTLYTVEDGQIIDPVSRETPTEGRELTILQQLFGNIGRFPTSETQ